GRCVIGAVVASALVLLGCLLLVPGIYLSTALALWPVALYIENDGALQSLETSRGLIQGDWWHSSAGLGAALLVVALFSMLVGVVTGVLELSAGATPAGEGLVQLISAVSDLISLPMPPAILLALYHDLRLRHTRGRPNLLP